MPKTKKEVKKVEGRVKIDGRNCIRKRVCFRRYWHFAERPNCGTPTGILQNKSISNNFIPQNTTNKALTPSSLSLEPSTC